MTKYIFYIGLLWLVVSCEKSANKPQVLKGNAFGTTYTIQYYALEAFDAQQGIDSVLHAVNQSVSTYLPESDISKINRGDATVRVDSIFWEVFQISNSIYWQSGGYFDPTIGVLRNAYGFGDTQPLAEMDSLALDSLMQYVGFKKVMITEEGTVQKEHPEIYFDFNAVAKGYGIDCLARYLDVQGATDYLIELGGEILAKGIHRQKEQPWVVGIEGIDSDLEDRSYVHTVALTNVAMASSGNYRKFRIDSLTGKKYVHTINPLTGLAEQSDVTSATVIASSCGFADAYATTFMAMGLEKSKVLLSKLDGVEAYLTYMDKDHQPQVFVTEGFQKRMLE